MATSGKETDASFFRLIHQLACGPPEGEGADRRTEPRRKFLSSQRIAPRRGREVPDESQFTEVACHDLSRGGFSFFLPHRPGFDLLAVAFDDPPDVIYMAAEVSHYKDVLVYSSGEVRPIRCPTEQDDDEDLDDTTATPMVLVGCRFQGRLHE